MIFLLVLRSRLKPISVVLKLISLMVSMVLPFSLMLDAYLFLVYLLDFFRE